MSTIQKALPKVSMALLLVGTQTISGNKVLGFGLLIASVLLLVPQLVQAYRDYNNESLLREQQHQLKQKLKTKPGSPQVKSDLKSK